MPPKGFGWFSNQLTCEKLVRQVAVFSTKHKRLHRRAAWGGVVGASRAVPEKSATRSSRSSRPVRHVQFRRPQPKLTTDNSPIEARPYMRPRPRVMGA